MTIEKWEKTDNDSVASIEKECFSSPWSVQMLDDCFARSDFYGLKCVEEGKIVAYVGTIRCGAEAELLNLAVTKEYRKRGIGFLLMQKLFDFLVEKKIEKVFLEVRKSNESAKRLYEKLGFDLVGERKKYYENTEDALVLVKVL